ncbi:MAG TPA: hypothetical protein VMD97_07390 [Candidatus Aquilonibacter sp.]|nr:hypothetical protein [Candidatus Aquilonibacter sp.]
MKQIFQNGRHRRMHGAIAIAALLCCWSASPRPVRAQSTGSKPPAKPVPELSKTPEIPTPALQPATPATPSMMPTVPGTTLDRVVAIVNGDLILDSDVNEEQRFEAFEPYRTPDEKLSRDRIIERLINRDLILQQLKLQPADEPSDADVDKQIAQLRKNIPACRRYDCESKAGWDRFLADNGFTEASLFKRWKQRMEVLDFIEDRFQMGIDITQAQIQSYYEKTLLPEYKEQNAPAPKLDAISGQIREVLLQQQITNLLSDWLQSLRAQGSVVVLHPGEEAP